MPDRTTWIMLAITAAILVLGTWALLHTYDGGNPGHIYPTNTTGVQIWLSTQPPGRSASSPV